MWPYIELLMRAMREPIRAVVAAPPQHGKTESTTHAITYAFENMPGRRHAYATYAQKRSMRVSRKTRAIAGRAGLDVHGTQEYWFDKNGSSILWTSTHGQFGGEPVDGLLVIDDPTKDRKEAESEIKRADQIDWFDDVAEPRCHSTASIVVMTTRWHPKDLPGVLIDRGWQYINLKALADGEVDVEGRVIGDPLRRFPGEALCEARQSREALEKKRKTNAFSFASLYQGEPRPREGVVFGEPHYYDELPDKGYRVAYGIDLAYSDKKKSDWSVIIRMYAVTEPLSIQERRDGKKPMTTFYVVDVVRKQVDPSSFLLTLKAKHSEQRGRMLWIASGTEKGAASFVRKHVPLEVVTASEDKYQRALDVAEAWNSGLVLVPRGNKIVEPSDETPSGFDEREEEVRYEPPEWLDVFLDEVLGFTGKNDPHDDIVDALAAGHRALLRAPVQTDDMPPPATYESPMRGGW